MSREHFHTPPPRNTHSHRAVSGETAIQAATHGWFAATCDEVRRALAAAGYVPR